MHKLEVFVTNLSPNRARGHSLTCGSWRAKVAHLHDIYLSSGTADSNLELLL